MQNPMKYDDNNDVNLCQMLIIFFTESEGEMNN